MTVEQSGTVERRQTYKQNEDETSIVRVRGVIDGSNENKVLFYDVNGGRKLSDYQLPESVFLERFTRVFTPDELDAEWRRLAYDTYDSPEARTLSEKFQQICRDYEEKLSELRALAEASLTKKSELTPEKLRQIHVDNGACSMSRPERMCISCREVELLKAELNNVEPDPSAGADA